MKRTVIHIQWCEDSKYRVSIPNWDGGKVVELKDYEELEREYNAMIQSLKDMHKYHHISNIHSLIDRLLEKSN